MTPDSGAGPGITEARTITENMQPAAQRSAVRVQGTRLLLTPDAREQARDAGRLTWDEAVQVAAEARQALAGLLGELEARWLPSGQADDLEGVLGAAVARLAPSTVLWAALQHLDAESAGRVRSWTRAQEEEAKRAAEETRRQEHEAWRAANPEAAAEQDRQAERRARSAAGHGWASQARSGCECDLCAEWWAQEDAWQERRAASIQSILDAYVAEKRAEWTRDLLGSTFAVGDGRTVTWGTATVADHRARLAMLAKMAAGTLETAAMHQQAVDDLTAAGADCLADLAGMAA